MIIIHTRYYLITDEACVFIAKIRVHHWLLVTLPLPHSVPSYPGSSFPEAKVPSNLQKSPNCLGALECMLHFLAVVY